MDIIDIAIARAKSFTGETAKLVKEAQQAMADANKIIDDVSAIESEATSASEVAQEAAAAAQAAAAEFDEMKADIEAAVARQLQPINSAVSSLDDRIDTIETTYSKVDLQNVSGTGYSGFSISNIINGTTETNTVKLYNAAGAQTDGAMTQKAVSDITSSLDSRVTVLESGGAHFDPAYASLLVSINSDGGLAPFNVSKSDVIQLMLKNEMFMSDDIFGIVIDYTNKTTLRMRGSADISTSQHAKLFKERVRCIVDSDGKILKFNPTAADLTSTYENKDVMVYQPAFYYLRIPYDIMYTNDGAYVTKELLAVTDNPNYGFKRHPAFYDINGKEVSYALFGAFEASVYDTSTNTYVELDDPSGGYNSAEDTLMSIYNKKPASGMHGSFNYNNATAMVANKGTGWSLVDSKYLSVNQMLMAIEYANLNIQNALAAGRTAADGTSLLNQSAHTGATVGLGNGSGIAEETRIYKFNSGGSGGSYITIYNSQPTLASFSYRGLENFYGNIWEYIKDMSVNNYQYLIDSSALTYKMPTSTKYILYFGYDTTSTASYDYLFLPYTVSDSANSTVPVGDQYFPGGSGANRILFGGANYTQNSAGAFCYSSDRSDTYTGAQCGTRIMFKSLYNASVTTYNYNKWLSDIDA